MSVLNGILLQLSFFFSVCLVRRRRELILIELSLRELIMVKSELDVN